MKDLMYTLRLKKGASEKVISSINELLENNNDYFGWKGNLIQLIENNRFKINTKS
jgi:hypothetical protein